MRNATLIKLGMTRKKFYARNGMVITTRIDNEERRQYQSFKHGEDNREYPTERTSQLG